MRIFETGATRDNDDTKPDYEGFLSPTAIAAFGRYMTRHQIQADGTRRASDNWQKGIPIDAYMKSAFRHFIEVWTLHRANKNASPEMEEALCALWFNVQGYLHERAKLQGSHPADTPSGEGTQGTSPDSPCPRPTLTQTALILPPAPF